MRSSKSRKQGVLFEFPICDRVVNVASVTHRSPFRYPGGKTWLVPRIRAWLASLETKPNLFLEPFAGGAIVGLTVAFENLAEKVLLVELDEDVAAAWQVILSKDNEWLAKQILEFEVTEESVRDRISTPHKNSRERAFKTILKNRTFHGGILAPGSAPTRFGENGKGIRSRWYARTIAKRIRDIAHVREKIEFRCADGIGVIEEHASMRNVVYFIDPPYTAAGKRAGSRLYTHHALDHDRLFKITSSTSGDVLMTYDNAAEIVAKAKRFGFATQTIAMKNTHHALMQELLIGRKLDWV